MKLSIILAFLLTSTLASAVTIEPEGAVGVGRHESSGKNDEHFQERKAEMIGRIKEMQECIQAAANKDQIQECRRRMHPQGRPGMDGSGREGGFGDRKKPD